MRHLGTPPNSDGEELSRVPEVCTLKGTYSASAWTGGAKTEGEAQGRSALRFAVKAIYRPFSLCRTLSYSPALPYSSWKHQSWKFKNYISQKLLELGSSWLLTVGSGSTNEVTGRRKIIQLPEIAPEGVCTPLSVDWQ